MKVYVIISESMISTTQLFWGLTEAIDAMFDRAFALGYGLDQWDEETNNFWFKNPSIDAILGRYAFVKIVEVDWP